MKPAGGKIKSESARVALQALVLGALLLTLLVLPGLPLETLLARLAEVRAARPGGSVGVFALLSCAGIILMLPAWVFMMAAGYLYGIALGWPLAVTANLGGALGAFLLTRKLGAGTVATLALRHPRFAVLQGAVARDGLTIVLLSRLAVVLPWNLLNYAYGASEVRVLHYTLGTLLGSLPLATLHVVIGSRAGELAAIVRGDLLGGPGFVWLSAAGLLALIVLLRLLIRYARNALDQSTVGEMPPDS